MNTAHPPAMEYLRQFNENIELIRKQSSPLFNQRRARGVELLSKLGIPGKHQENYKYTGIDKILEQEIRLALSPNAIHLDLEEVFKCDVPELETRIILLLNGFYHDKDNPLINLGKGGIAGSLAEATRQYPGLISKHFGKYMRADADGMVAMNSIFAQDGFFLWLPKGVVLEKPIQIINIGLWEEDLMINQQNLFILEEASQAGIILCDHTLAPWKFVTNSVTEIYTGENAVLDYVNVQNENNSSSRVSSVFVQQETGSRVSTNTISLHGGLIRNNLYATLDGTGADNQALGLYLTDRSQHIDNFTIIEHASPSCTSVQLFKGVLDDDATGAFSGKVLVRQDAQKTSAYQANNNILLTDQAKIHSRPQLEIYADDVKCSHGATIGQLDDNALFYLRSRGVGLKEARLMLMYAFADEVISRISVQPLRERISDLVEKRLRGELSRCNNCQISCGKIEC